MGGRLQYFTVHRTARTVGIEAKRPDNEDDRAVILLHRVAGDLGHRGAEQDPQQKGHQNVRALHICRVLLTMVEGDEGCWGGKKLITVVYIGGDATRKVRVVHLRRRVLALFFYNYFPRPFFINQIIRLGTIRKKKKNIQVNKNERVFSLPSCEVPSACSCCTPRGHSYYDTAMSPCLFPAILGYRQIVHLCLSYP